MAVGFSATLVGRILNYLRGTAPTAISGLYCQLHTGNPGTAGTSNVSSVTTRVAATMAAEAGGTITQNGTDPSWTSWAGSSETVSHISVWDAPSGGNFLYSFALTTPRAMTSGDTFTLDTHSVGLPTAS